jgi:ubiquinone/menaquinone biosynthesis C-methylase UbiE
METEKIKNIYNEDVRSTGRYLYTDKDVYSAGIATLKQTAEILKMIRSNFPSKIRILDIGCGDGTYSLELLRGLQPEKIVGFDVADAAIKFAGKHIPAVAKNRIFFEIGDVYKLSGKYSRKDFDLAVFRGVLHHLDHPRKAVTEVARVCDNVIILEPNGFNPILKLIEKLSPYHVRHGEKSYWPPDLDNWFGKNGYRVVNKKYFSIVPYFCPEILTRILKAIEPVFENLPFINRFYCGALLVFYQKNASSP